MLNQTYYGIVTKIGDVYQDEYGDDYQEITFSQVHTDRQINGRIVSVRLLHSFVDSIYDMIICQNYRIFSYGKGNQIRLDRDWYTFAEYVGNQSCKNFADESMYDRMLQQQSIRKRISRSQSRIDQFFRRI
ncbi:unnamed protein product [Paramecium sonneborni]|uniref:Uncharacterized protein n=1 Tax=Paramecium sonneborni TaxID=65129 RepID=A0A8S1KV11_9CILI|nr:unnamed protein product [Paramecium sonneborni]